MKDTSGELGRRLSNQATMISNVAHDLRQPLFRLALAAELASAGVDDRSGLARTIHALSEALPSMKRLVDDLDDLGSLQAGRLRLSCLPISLGEVVAAAVAAYAPLAASREIDLSAIVDDALPETLADRDRLLQVVSNLLSNALCLTPSGGVIIVAVEHHGGEARFTVSDSGPGIKPADLPHLFDRYWRGPHGYAGRGLGLAIARELVEAHHGRIWADNRPVRGAKISFTVPLTRTGHPTRPSRQDRANPLAVIT